MPGPLSPFANTVSAQIMYTVGANMCCQLMIEAQFTLILSRFVSILRLTVLQGSKDGNFQLSDYSPHIKHSVDGLINLILLPKFKLLLLYLNSIPEASLCCTLIPALPTLFSMPFNNFKLGFSCNSLLYLFVSHILTFCFIFSFVTLSSYSKHPSILQ